MARKTFAELKAELTTIFPDNTTGQITPDRFWAYFTSIFDAIEPATALLAQPGPAVQSLVPAASPVVFATVTLSTVPDFSGAAASGTVIRLRAGTSRFTINGTAEGPNGKFLNITLFKAGVATGLATRINLQGSNNPVSFAIDGLDTSTADLTSYQLRVASESNLNATFSNLRLLAEVVPA